MEIQNIQKLGFPFQYHDDDVLTDKQVDYGIGIVYIKFLLSGLTPTIGPIVSVSHPIYQIGLPVFVERQTRYDDSTARL